MGAPLRLLVRSWVSGKGCVYQRSRSLPELEALEILEAARSSIEKAQESGTIEEILLPEGRAFVKARRSPDPDQPNRTAPGFVLVSIPDPRAFLLDVIAQEFDVLFRDAAHKTLDNIPLPTEGDPGKRDWQPMDLGKSPTSSISQHKLKWNNRPKRGLVALILLIASLFALSVIAPNVARIWKTSTNNKDRTQAELTQPNDDPDPKASEWEEMREQIQKVLDEPWIKQQVVKHSPSEGANRKLIQQFAGLFQRPDLNLNDNELKKFNILSPSEDPFVAFLSRLLAIERVPSIPDARTDLTPTEALQYLRDLERELKRIQPFGIDLQLDQPKTLADRTETSLDYPEFYNSWRKAAALYGSGQERREDDLWGRNRDGDAAYLWVKPVRSLIESRYFRQTRRQFP
jgi:hypothetical protein